MRVVRTVVMAGVIAAGLPALAQTPVLRPGKYAIETTMEMPGGQKMPPMKQEQCITAADLKDMSKGVMPKEMADTCKVSDYKATATKITFNAACNQGGVSSTMAFESTLTPDTQDTVIKAKSAMGEMTIKMAGKRVGDCTK
jgi:hypothetical protein